MGFLNSAWGFLKKGANFVGKLFGNGNSSAGWANIAQRAYNGFRQGSLLPAIKDMGNTAADVLLTNGVNAVFDGKRNFASSTVQRMFPTLVEPMSKAGDQLKQRLQGGYRELLYGKNPGSDNTSMLQT